MIQLKYLLALLVGLPLALAIKYRRNYSYWSKRGIPGPTPLPFIGNYLPYIFRTYIDVDKDFRRRYGHTYGIYLGARPILVTSDIELIHQIWVERFHDFQLAFELDSEEPVNAYQIGALIGSDWKRVRSVMTTAFTSAKMRLMMDKITEALPAFYTYLDSKASNHDQEINLEDLFSRLIMDINMKCFFSLDTNVYATEDHKLLASALGNFKNFTTINYFMIEFIPHWINKLFGIGVQDQEFIEYMQNFLEHHIKQRIDSGEKHNDLFQGFIDSRATNQENADKGMKDIELVANSIAFVAGALLTSTNIICLLLRQLALRPDVQKNVQAEIERVVGNDLDRKVDYEDLKSMVYMESLINEVIRYDLGIGTRLERQATTDTVLPGTDVPLEAGIEINVALGVVSYDPAHFKDPEQFIPQRFIPGSEYLLNPKANLNFGAGPRMCLGIRFAYLNLKIVLIEMLRRYQFIRSKRTLDNLKWSPGNISVETEQLYVKVEKRIM